MITKIKTMTINQIVERKDDLLVSTDDIKGLARNVRNKAIDDALEASAKAICIGCGYLDGYKCTYKGANCGVSKPMLESVTKALEQLKRGDSDVGI